MESTQEVHTHIEAHKHEHHRQRSVSVGSNPAYAANGHLQTDADLISLWPCSMSSAIEEGESRALEPGASSSVAQSESALTFASASPPPAHLRRGGLAAMSAGRILAMSYPCIAASPWEVKMSQHIHELKRAMESVTLRFCSEREQQSLRMYVGLLRGHCA